MKYSIKIKTCKADFFGFKEEKYKNLRFHLYQRIYAIFFFPIFPLNKYWKVTNKLTGKEVLPPDGFSVKMDLKLLKIKSPIWSFGGVIIIVGFIIFVFGFLSFRDLSYIYSDRTDNNKVKELAISKIQLSEKGSIHNFKAFIFDKKKPKSSPSKEVLAYKIISSNKDSILFELTPASLSELKRFPPTKDFYHYVESHENKFWVIKKNIIRAINRSPPRKYEYGVKEKGSKIPRLYNYGLFRYLGEKEISSN